MLFSLIYIINLRLLNYCIIEQYSIIISSVLILNFTTLSSSNSQVNDILLKNYFLFTLISLSHPSHSISISYIIKNNIKLLITFKKSLLIFYLNLIFIFMLIAFQLNICFLIFDSISLNFGFNTVLFQYSHYLKFMLLTFQRLC